MPGTPTAADPLPGRSRLATLLEHFASIEDPRDVRRILHPLREVLLLVVCGTIADCDDYDAVADWGEAQLDFLRQHLPYAHGVPGGRWLTTLMNRINPALFSAAFTAWVRATWPARPDFVAIDGETSRRSHDRAAGDAPLHLVSAFATASRLAASPVTWSMTKATVASRREVSVIREVDWLAGDRRFPGELRLPHVACLVRVLAETERAG